ncbi:helix-turn-helix transcriptional regulator [Amycolatopsis sp. NPDC051373]|uniref:helix-turn-helix domain-containing protein n=1 Tax=Amycolatopsis sp. NPDC051373 TaxID=3155801 RepID=UPI00344F6269
MSNLPHYEADELDELLGIDYSDPQQRLAHFLVEQDYQCLADLVEIRKARGLSRDEVAERMGRTVEQVADFECVNSDPCLSTIRRYALAVHAMVSHVVTPVLDED